MQHHNSPARSGLALIALFLSLSLIACTSPPIIRKPIPIEIVKREPIPVDPALLVPVERYPLPTAPILWSKSLKIMKAQDELLKECNARFPAIEKYQTKLRQKNTSD